MLHAFTSPVGSSDTIEFPVFRWGRPIGGGNRRSAFTPAAGRRWPFSISPPSGRESHPWSIPAVDRNAAIRAVANSGSSNRPTESANRN